MPKSTFASRLRRARLARGLGSRELDRKAKLNEGHVSVLEGRGGDASATTTEKLARALDVDATWLLFGTGIGPKGREKRAAAAKPARAARLTKT
jgi:transcriptional regulator with XRE-family HTH domain